MAQQFAEIEITAKTRPCWVNGRRAIFHRWTDNARPAKARAQENDPEAGYFQLYSVHALVEFEDGKMVRVWPNEVRFADGGEFAAYDWERMEEKRDELPYTISDLESYPPDKIPQAMRTCMNCGVAVPRCDLECTTCQRDSCRCRNCSDNDLWIPQGGANG